jgi:hypothetical protein
MLLESLHKLLHQQIRFFCGNSGNAGVCLNVLSFKVDESVAESCIRGTAGRLDCQTHIKDTRFDLEGFVLNRFRSFSLAACSCVVGHRRGSSEVNFAGNYVVHDNPAVVTTRENAVDVLVSDTGDVLEGGARLKVLSQAPTGQS